MRSLSEDLFNKDIVDEYLCLLNNEKPCIPPSIVIEVVFSGEEDTVALYKGDFNSCGVAESGIKLEIAIDAESFSDEYQDFVAAKSHHGLPIEYYACSWTTFARKSIRPASIKFKSTLVGAGNSLAWPGSKAMVTRIARDVLEKSDQIAISDIPFSNVGDGTKSIVSTELALAKSEKRGGNVVLLEEPENHLSHTRLNMFLEGVKSRCEDVQLIITTHSSFVANKLELRNLILLNGGNSASMRDLSEDTSRFFMKAPGYKTLRVLLCDTAILVEGDADELVVQRAYMDASDGKLPIQDGVDVISVGTSFLRFLEVADVINKRVIAMTDNDGNIGALEKKYQGYKYVTLAQEDELQVVSYANRLLEKGSMEGINYNTLEAEMYESVGAEMLSKILGKEFKDRDSALKYMEGNKTEVALKIFDSVETLSYPEYIMQTIAWARGELDEI